MSIWLHDIFQIQESRTSWDIKNNKLFSGLYSDCHRPAHWHLSKLEENVDSGLRECSVYTWGLQGKLTLSNPCACHQETIKECFIWRMKQMPCFFSQGLQSVNKTDKQSWTNSWSSGRAPPPPAVITVMWVQSSQWSWACSVSCVLHVAPTDWSPWS